MVGAGWIGKAGKVEELGAKTQAGICAGVGNLVEVWRKKQQSVWRAHNRDKGARSKETSEKHLGVTALTQMGSSLRSQSRTKHYMEVRT